MVVAPLIWLICWGVVVWSTKGQELKLARLSDAELQSIIDAECKLRVRPDECPKATEREGVEVKNWGGGDGYSEQAYRVGSRLLPDLAILFGPPISLLLLGSGVAWVLRGFVKPQ
jgi:hypothetical protein